MRGQVAHDTSLRTTRLQFTTRAKTNIFETKLFYAKRLQFPKPKPGKDTFKGLSEFAKSIRL